MNEGAPSGEKETEILRGMLERINNYLSGWSNEIPDRILHSTDKDRNYKVRKGWFNGIVGEIGLLDYMGGVAGPEKAVIDNFTDEFCAPEFNTRLTTAEDIKKGDEVLILLKTVVEKALQDRG